MIVRCSTANKVGYCFTKEVLWFIVLVDNSIVNSDTVLVSSSDKASYYTDESYMLSGS